MLTLSSSKLKARLGQYMRAVRGGDEIVVTDRDVPVARLVPYEPGDEHAEQAWAGGTRDPAAPPLGEVEVRAVSYSGPSTGDLLRGDRDRR